MSAIVFIDTETTGLSLDDDIWEFAAIRREEDGSETEHHLFLIHSFVRCRQLPQPFLDDHDARYPDGHGVEPDVAARSIAAIFEGRPHVVGAVPNFDTERLALLLRRFGLEPGWHYRLIDVENLAVGYLHGTLHTALTTGSLRPDQVDRVFTLPWDSDELSRAVGVDPDQFERHTAMGDAKWARAIYDAIMASPS